MCREGLLLEVLLPEVQNAIGKAPNALQEEQIVRLLQTLAGPFSSVDVNT